MPENIPEIVEVKKDPREELQDVSQSVRVLPTPAGPETAAGVLLPVCRSPRVLSDPLTPCFPLPTTPPLFPRRSWTT
jgi:hypothetical protein